MLWSVFVIKVDISYLTEIINEEIKLFTNINE